MCLTSFSHHTILDLTCSLIIAIKEAIPMPKQSENQHSDRQNALWNDWRRTWYSMPLGWSEAGGEHHGV